MNPADYQYVCFGCARKARERAGLPEQAKTICTVNTAACDCCGKTTGVAHVRNSGYPWSARYWQHWT